MKTIPTIWSLITLFQETTKILVSHTFDIVSELNIVLLYLSAIIEAVSKHLKKRDRKLTEYYHNLAVPDNFHPVYNDHFKKVIVHVYHAANLYSDLIFRLRSHGLPGC